MVGLQSNFAKVETSPLHKIHIHLMFNNPWLKWLNTYAIVVNSVFFSLSWAVKEYLKLVYYICYLHSDRNQYV